MFKLKKLRVGIAALVLLAVPALSYSQLLSIGVSIHVAPPILPVYVQPPCPTDGYLWTPGYWSYGPEGYFWVPGVWVAPPRVGLLWTPGYWGFDGGLYAWHAGYWGPHVGFYGGVNYGFGYIGTGFVGGVWAGNVFRYNTAVLNVNTTVIHNTYVNRTVINNVTVNHVSFNGPGGIAAQPTAQERMAMHESHVAATANQMAHQRTASQDRSQWASANGGHPGTLAMNTVHGQRFNQEGHAQEGQHAQAAHAAGAAGRPANQPHNEGRQAQAGHPAAAGRPAGQERPQAERERPQAGQERAQAERERPRPAQERAQAPEREHNGPHGAAEHERHEGPRR
jgi:hypothetical protein